MSKLRITLENPFPESIDEETYKKCSEFLNKTKLKAWLIRKEYFKKNKKLKPFERKELYQELCKKYGITINALKVILYHKKSPS